MGNHRKTEKEQLSTVPLWKTYLTKVKIDSNSLISAWKIEVNPGRPGRVYHLLEVEYGTKYLICTDTAKNTDARNEVLHWIASLGSHPSTPEDSPTENLSGFGNQVQEISLPAFPGITFLFNGTQTAAIDANGNPVLLDCGHNSSVLFADLTDDGTPEICGYHTIGSTIIVHSIYAYDCIENKKYTYTDDDHLFNLKLKVENGNLHYYKKPYRSLFDQPSLESGRVLLTGSSPFKNLSLCQFTQFNFGEEAVAFGYDEEYNDRIEHAVSNVEIGQIHAEFVEKYKVFIDEYHLAILEISSGSLESALINEQAEWEMAAKRNIELKLEELKQQYGAGTAVPVVLSRYEYKLYRDRARELSILYTHLKNNTLDLDLEYPIVLVDGQDGIEDAYVLGSFQAWRICTPDKYLYNGKHLSFYLFQQETEVTSDILDVAKPFTFMAPDGNRTTATVNVLRCVPQAIDETVRVKAGLTYSSQPNSQWLLGTYSTVDIFPKELIRKDQFLSADLNGDSNPEQVSWSFTPADPGLYGDGYYYYSITVEQNGTAYTIPGTEYLPTTKDDLAVFPADLNQDGYYELIIAERRMSRFGYVSIYQFVDDEYELIMNYELNGEP